MLNGRSILITGGTGSFGRAFSSYAITRFPNLKRLVIFSRDELKQFEMSQSPPFLGNDKVRFFLGDVRDLQRVRFALEGIDIVIHAAALKQVTAAEYNPFEFIQTNVIGAQNLIEAVMSSDVSTLIALSTDKAASPINLYGATKLASDKLFVAANRIKGKRDLKLSVVRYGNVLGSRGSVIPFFQKIMKKGFLPITDPKMTRFNILLSEGVEMVLWALKNAEGGEIFVPKIPSYRITDVADAICPDCEKRIVGIRPGEKLHEELITSSDARSTIDLGKYYAILPSFYSASDVMIYLKNVGGAPMESTKGFTSNSNPDFLNIQQLKTLITEFNVKGDQL